MANDAVIKTPMTARERLDCLIAAIIEIVETQWPVVLPVNPHPFYTPDLEELFSNETDPEKALRVLAILDTAEGKEAAKIIGRTIYAIRDGRKVIDSWVDIDDAIIAQGCEGHILPLAVGFASGLLNGGLEREDIKRRLRVFLGRFAEPCRAQQFHNCASSEEPVTAAGDNPQS